MNVMTRSEVLRQKQAMRQRIRAIVHARRIAMVVDAKEFELSHAEPAPRP